MTPTELQRWLSTREREARNGMRRIPESASADLNYHLGRAHAFAAVRAALFTRTRKVVRRHQVQP